MRSRLQATAPTLDPRRLTVLIVAIAALSTAWILLRTYYGARLTIDAASYLSGAENLAAGNGLTDYQGRELTWFPPGYSIVLAGFEIAGIGAAEGGRWLNAVLFGVIVGISGLWLKTVCRSSAVVLAGVIAIACSSTFHTDAVSLHSEPLYLLLTIGSLILVGEVLNRHPAVAGPKGPRLLATAGLLVGLSFAVRYVGVVAIVSSFLVLLVWRPSRSAMRIRLQAATVFGLAAALPTAAVVARNLSETGRVLGDRLDRSSGDTMLDALETTVRLQTRPAFAIPLVILAAAALISWTVRSRSLSPAYDSRTGIEDSRTGTAGGAPSRIARSAPFAAFVLLYVPTLVITQPWNQGPINARLWLPAAIGMLFVGCEALDSALDGGELLKAPRIPRLRVLAAGAGAVIVVALLASSYHAALHMRNALSLGHPDGEDVRGIVESPVIAYLEQNATDDGVYTNRVQEVYLLTGIQPVNHLPARAPGQTWTESECLNQFNKAADRHTRTQSPVLQIAWFDGTVRLNPRVYCDLEDLASLWSELTLVQDFPDGAIYRFDPSP